MIPLILYWKDASNDSKSSSRKQYNLRDTYNHIIANKKLLIFLFSYWIYIDGVDTIIRMAVNYGITIGFGSSDLLIALLVIQFVGFPAVSNTHLTLQTNREV